MACIVELAPSSGIWLHDHALTGKTAGRQCDKYKLCASRLYDKRVTSHAASKAILSQCLTKVLTLLLVGLKRQQETNNSLLANVHQQWVQSDRTVHICQRPLNCAQEFRQPTVGAQHLQTVHVPAESLGSCAGTHAEVCLLPPGCPHV